MPKAYYLTDKYNQLEREWMLPRLTIEEQIVIRDAKNGPGITEKELVAYSELSPYDVKRAIKSLVDQQLLTEGPTEEWHET